MTCSEVRAALKKLMKNKACGPDTVPADIEGGGEPMVG